MITKPRPPSVASIATVTQAPPCVDLERFRADLRDAGIEEMIGSLLDTFVQDAPARFAALEQAVHAGNSRAIESAAHAFKSGAGTIRATSLAESLRDIEAAGRIGHLESMNELLEQIRGEYLAVLCELEPTKQ